MTNTILAERLNIQPLTEEEKQQRHILGRLFGPIATCLESTRNGRKYNRQLWEKALNDEIFHEKLANKCLFLELGHPADREEVDMKQVCACIPEMPKIIDGDLCASVDILDTPNGRLLKTLVDYGFVPGISSRGSGDIMDNDEVDPETFFLECFDIVSIPAVKKARLNICESLSSNNIKLKKALAESYKAAKEEDKSTMKKALENLNINIEEEISDNDDSEKILTAEDIPWAPEEEVLVEEMPAEDESDETEVTEDEAEDSDEDSAEENTEIEENSTEEEKEAASDEIEEPSEDDTEEKSIVDTNEYDEIADLDTVGDAIEMLQEYDDDVRVELEPIEIEGKEYQVDAFTSFVDDEGEEDILVLGVHCKEAEEDSDAADSDIEQEIEDEATVETIEEVDDEDESAEDAGDEEVIESLKEMIRQKEALEAEISDLRKAKSVGDAKEQELQEKLIRYKAAFKTTSAEAAKVPKLELEVKALHEKLTQLNTTIKTLTDKVNNAQQLKESLDSSKNTTKRLNEEIVRLTEKSETLETKLKGQAKVFTEKLQERTNLAKTYKARFVETLKKYVESKASMLGVQPSEITSRLNENYTLTDVDAVCDQILSSTMTFSRLPFGGRTKTSVRIAESASNFNRKEPEYGYDIDDSLLELAGLKK